MAALRQLLNTRDLPGSLYPRALPEESRQMVKAKMEAIGYPISPHPPAVPEKEMPGKSHEHDANLSLKPVRYQESSQRNYEAESDSYDRSTYTSVYEQRLSQDISSALSNHLAHRPRTARNNSETNINGTIYENRRRSRSAADEAYDASAWSEQKSGQARRPPREDSRSTSQPARHYREGSEPISERHELRKSPETDNGAFQSLATIGNSKKKPYKSTKSHSNNSTKIKINTNVNTHQPSTSHSSSDSNSTTKHSNPTTTPDTSPSTSTLEGVKHTLPTRDTQPLERKRPAASSSADEELDYTPAQLASKPYSDLASEPFDHNPASFFTTHANLINHLPPSSLPLPARLQALYDMTAPSPNPNPARKPLGPTDPRPTRTTLSQTLFATLPIEAYEESGAILLDRFSGVVGRLIEARRAKRKVCMAMEEEVAAREAWVRRKRGCVGGAMEGLRVGGGRVVYGGPRGGQKGGGREEAEGEGGMI